MAPVFLAMALLVGGALVVAVMQNKQDDKENQAAAAGAADEVDGPKKPNPFGDRDNDPPGRSGSGSKMQNTAPEGLDQTPLWIDASAKAERGMKLVKEAVAARKEGDEETFRTKGSEGYDLLDEALLNTGDWLLGLIEQHPNDRQVNRISRQRGRWGDAYEKVRKVK